MLNFYCDKLFFLSALLTPPYFVTSVTLSVAMVTFGWYSVYLFRLHLLISLLSLEIVTLGIFLFLTTMMSQMGMPVSVGLYILVMGACEAVLGLSLLISLTRCLGMSLYGNMKLMTY